MRQYTEFQSPTMPGTCQNVCVVRWGAVRWGGCKPILVFSFGQAEQQLMANVSVQICSDWVAQIQVRMPKKNRK